MESGGVRRRTSARPRHRRGDAPARNRTGRLRDGRPAARRRARTRTARCRRRADRRSRSPAGSRARSTSRQRCSLRSTWSRSGPGRSSYSVTAAEQHAAAGIAADPVEPVVHDRAQPRQAARLRQRRHQHRFAEPRGRRFEHRQLQVLARSEMGEHAALGHADRLRQRADRQAFDAGEAGDVVGAIDDGFAGGGAFGGGGQCAHGRTIARPFVLIDRSSVSADVRRQSR